LPRIVSALRTFGGLPVRARPLAALAAAAIAAALLLPSMAVAQDRSLAEIEAELERTQAAMRELDERMQAATVELEVLRARIAELEAERRELLDEVDALRGEVAELEELIAFRVRETFKHGSNLDPVTVFLASDDPQGALSRAEVVNRVVGGDRARTEELVAARERVDAVEARLAEQADELERSEVRLSEVAEQLLEDFEAAQELEDSLSDEAKAERARLEREREERQRRERERAERERQAQAAADAARREAASSPTPVAAPAGNDAPPADQADEPSTSSSSSTASSSSSEANSSSRSSSTPGGSSTSSSTGAPSSGATSNGSSGDSSGASSSDSSNGSSSGSSGASSSGSTTSSTSSGSSGAATSSGARACPLDQPRHFNDTWGAPRSGGRAHRGTDIMGPHSIPVRAIVAGTWQIQPYGASAGHWAVLHGDDGNHYWYLHLERHTVGNGARVNAGQQVATNGATGNAPPNMPHIHFELHPGGGGAINPYPTLRSVCG
jgi:peptidoglycan LD-endopeptidase LytH